MKTTLIFFILLIQFTLNITHADTNITGYLYSMSTPKPYALNNLNTTYTLETFPQQTYIFNHITMLRMFDPIIINNIFINDFERYTFLTGQCLLTLEIYDKKTGYFRYKAEINNLSIQTVMGKYSSLDKDILIDGDLKFNVNDQSYATIEGNYAIINGQPVITTSNKDQLFVLGVRDNYLTLTQTQVRIPITIQINHSSFKSN